MIKFLFRKMEFFLSYDVRFLNYLPWKKHLGGFITANTVWGKICANYVNNIVGLCINSSAVLELKIHTLNGKKNKTI